MATPRNNAPTVACPHCGEPALYAPQNKWRPFCSERCKMIDLGAWANESYRIPVQENDAGLSEDNTPQTEQ